MAEIKVVNKRNHRPNRMLDFPVHRGFPLGNPYDWRGFERGPEFKVSCREEAIAKYKVWIAEQIASRNPEVCAALNKIYKRIKAGEDVNLVCYCEPLDCHAWVVKQIIESKLD